jgi:predicted transcriptional regulator YdeE
VIKQNEYAIFHLASRNQNDIVTLEQRINKQWVPSTNYNIKNSLKIELYKKDSCDLFIPIE